MLLLRHALVASFLIFTTTIAGAQTSSVSSSIADLLSPALLSSVGVTLSASTTTTIVPSLQEALPHEFLVFVKNGGSAPASAASEISVFRATLPTYVDSQFLASITATAPAVIDRLDSLAAAQPMTSASILDGQLASLRRDPPTASGQSFSSWVAGSLKFESEQISGQSSTRDITAGTFGLDVGDRSWRMGLAATVTSISPAGATQAEPSRALIPAVYAAWFPASFYIQGSLNYAPGFAINGITRPAAYGRTATGNTRASGLVFDAEAGFRTKPDSYVLTPFLGLTQAHTHVDGYTETGAAGGNIAYASHAFTQTLIRGGTEASLPLGVVTPWARVGWQRSLASGGRLMVASLAALQTSDAARSIPLQTFGGNSALFSAGLQGSLVNVWSWRLGFDSLIAVDGGKSSRSVTAGVRLTF